MNVFLVIRDDGNCQVAEESVDSVWLTLDDANNRLKHIVGLARIEQFTLGAVPKSANVPASPKATPDA